MVPLPPPSAHRTLMITDSWLRERDPTSLGITARRPLAQPVRAAHARTLPGAPGAPAPLRPCAHRGSERLRPTRRLRQAHALPALASLPDVRLPVVHLAAVCHHGLDTAALRGPALAAHHLLRLGARPPLAAPPPRRLPRSYPTDASSGGKEVGRT